MTDFEFNLEDRIAKIQAINSQYDLENNAYISFSGGKDSVVLHHLIDLALPNNKIPRVYIRTPFEYRSMWKYVERERERDNRIIIIVYNKNVKELYNKIGYPFKSKNYSQLVSTFQNHIPEIRKVFDEIDNSKDKEVKLKDLMKTQFLGKSVVSAYYHIKKNSEHNVPNILKYQFSGKDIGLKISDRCCYEMKELMLNKYGKENNKKITITGLMKEEGGRRAFANCVNFDNKENLRSFNPMLILTKQWEEEFIKRYEIKLCELYYEPYNFKRTGCKGCPYNLDLFNDLQSLYENDIIDYNQAIIQWKPVYDEYIRIGYRLKYYPHMRVKKHLF